MLMSSIYQRTTLMSHFMIAELKWRYSACRGPNWCHTYI